MKIFTVILDFSRRCGLGRKELRTSAPTPHTKSNMSTTPGNSDSFSIPPVTRPNSSSGPAVPPVANSPFTAVGNAGEAGDLQKAKSPFQVAEPSDSFGFEATTKTDAAAPAAVVRAMFGQSSPPSFAAPSASASAPASGFGDLQADSSSIRQLELRAIFGVDREMTEKEIIERCLALPGIQNIARVNPQDMGTIDALKGLMSNLGFGSGGLRLYAGPAPLEFIREGAILLAVQADGGFAPGVRETLMLVAREFGRPS